VVWSAAVSIHVARMDRHHMKLIEIANAVVDNLAVDGDRKSLESVIDALVDYAAYHFDAEEKLMVSYGYPGFEEHRRKHLELLRQVSEYRDQMISGTIPDQTAFQRFFEAWLVEHILEEDHKYGAFLNSKGVY